MQYKITCGYMPHEEQCVNNGQCEGCGYAEPVKPLEVKVITAPNWNPVCCSEGQGVGWFNGDHPDCCGNCLSRQFLAAVRESEDFQRTVAAIINAEKYICPLCGEPLHDEVYAPDFRCGKCQNFVEGVKNNV